MFDGIVLDGPQTLWHRREAESVPAFQRASVKEKLPSCFALGGREGIWRCLRTKARARENKHNQRQCPGCHAAQPKAPRSMFEMITKIEKINTD